MSKKALHAEGLMLKTAKNMSRLHIWLLNLSLTEKHFFSDYTKNYKPKFIKITIFWSQMVYMINAYDMIPNWKTKKGL